MPTGGSWPYSRVSARRNCDDAIDRLGRRRHAQPKPDFPRPLRIRPRTTSHIAEEQQQGTATRDVCGISPAWSPPRSGLARLVRRFRAGMYTGSRKPAVDCARGDNKTCRLAGAFTGATGLEPATSGVTGRVGRNDARRRATQNALICRCFLAQGRALSAWLSQSSGRRLGHEWATKSCLCGQRHARHEGHPRRSITTIIRGCLTSLLTRDRVVQACARLV